jgi:RNA-directed DNA polymerase
MEFDTPQFFNPKVISWDQSLSYLFRLQKRLFKSFLVADYRKCLLFQKLILQSNSSRLLAIREVTQLSSFRKIPGSDGKIFLTFIDRFELNELLRIHFNNWYPSPVSNITSLDKTGHFQILRLATISDRVWQLLVRYSIEPIYESFFHPHNFGFRVSSNVFELQKFIFLNFSLQSNSIQKRVFIIDLKNVFVKFDIDVILEKLIAPRGVKLGLFRSFHTGFRLDFPSRNVDQVTLSSLLANIVLNDINYIHPSIRFGYNFLFILKPFDDEKLVFNAVLSYLKLYNLDNNISVCGIFSPFQGFDFLDFNYIFCSTRGLLITPSFSNYQAFLFRVKHILNNSNYGSAIKASKLSPIIKEWKIYNRFCSINTPRFSLFYLKKRAFQIFNKESKQDSYSAKKLLQKSFINVLNSDKHFLELETEKCPYYGHLAFLFKVEKKDFFSNNSSQFCIHCGLKC